MKIFELYLFGPTQVWIQGQQISQFRSHKIRDLLIYLTINANQPQPRNTLAALLWSDYPDRVARTNLRNTLAQLRKLLAPVLADNPDFLHSTRQTIQLNFDPQTDYCDVHQVEAALSSYQSHQHETHQLCPTCLAGLTHSVVLYQGEFLSDLGQTDTSLFTEWRLEQQEYYHRHILLACQALADYHFAQADYAQAERYLRRQLSLEPWLEQVHQQLMHTLALNGQRGAALSQYESCQQILAQELGVEPSPETTQLYEQIRADSLSAVGPKALTPEATAVRHNLSPDMTPFFGRETELSQLKTLLIDSAYRLISLVGMGGIGKTRLALTSAKQVVEQFREGVWFVPLAGVDVGDNQAAPHVENILATSIAEALSLSFYETESPKAQLLAYLHPKNLLLVLDNFEHLLAGADFILAMLKHAPQLAILVTSREQFGLQAEYIIQLEGLPIPEAVDSAETLATYSAVQLFVERADRTRRGFAITPDNTQAVIRICRMLTGLPLGIELAATWTRVMSCAEIIQEMNQDLDFLHTTHRDVPNRHRSLRAVFEHSWQMLSPTEQRVLSQLSIFRGDFSQEAALNVCETNLRLLMELIDKSLLQQIGPGRYQIHELLRQFSTEKLNKLATQTNLIQRAEARHARYYLSFIQRREHSLNERQARLTLAEIRDELKNVRQAWRWAAAQPDLALIQQSLEGLTNFYYLTGLLEEGIKNFERAVHRLQAEQTSDPDQTLLTGHLFIEKARFLAEQAKTDEAISAAKSALTVGQQSQNSAIIAASHLWWGRALWRQGNFEAAQTQLEQCLTYAQNCLPEIEVLAWRTLGSLHFDQGDYAQDLIYVRRALQICRQLRNYREEGFCQSNLGHILMCLGNYADAQRHLEQALDIHRELGNRVGEAIALEAFGNLHYRLEAYEPALHYLDTALTIYEQIDDREGIGYTLTYLANAAVGQNQLDRAEALYSQALMVRQASGQTHLISENQAGLAHIAFLQGKLPQAQSQVEAILSYLENNTLKGEDLLRVYLTCYQVLQATQDERAAAILNTAHTHLQTQAAKIDDETLRHSFLENVALHRQLRQLVQSQESRVEISS